ncbi:MAG: hypothetical protein Q9170_003197 [Blastenia crenularia]
MSAKGNGNTSTSSDIHGPIDIKGLTRERPWLLPSNRKLRHLEGISLRNLTLSRNLNPPQAKAIDDASLPNALKTPAKSLALREKKLEHSRSSSDLHTPPKSRKILEPDRNNGDSDTELKPVRPLRGKIRRRSTLNWAYATPQIRQQKLEDVAGSRLADTWFSLHCEGIAEPVYVSEVVEKAMNPNFRFFDLNTYGPWVTRRDEITIKFWARIETKKLESFRHPLPQNCVLLHLSDDLPLDEPVLAISTGPKNAHNLQPTSTFDDLMRLSNLDDCIQDALATREKLTSQISGLLKKQKDDRQLVQSAAQAQDSYLSTSRAVSTLQKQIKTARGRRSELQGSLRARREAIRSGTLSQEKSQCHLKSARSNFASHVSLHGDTQSDIRAQVRRVCEDVLQIYPIEAIPQKALSFTIRGLPLPNATSPSLDPSTSAAALGHAAHVTYLLSLYLSAALPYPVSPYGSFSTIYDPISISLQSEAARTFPLYQKGAVTYRFEYGVFLLNSDIESLMSKQGIRTVDLRHTLPNLKYLLTVLTSGKGDVPGRKGGRSGLKSNLYGEDDEVKPAHPRVDDSMARPRPRRTSSAVGDNLRGDTGASALSTLEPTPTLASPPVSPNFQPQDAPEPQEPQEAPHRHRRRRRVRGFWRRWHELAFKHTWLNPLIIILVVLALYAIYPKPTNPLCSAIFLSYPLSPSDPSIPANVRANPEAPVHYGKGRKDFAFVAFYIVVLSFTREFIMQRILRPTARWFRLRTRSKQNRFMEQTYTAIYFGIFGPYGVYVMYRSPVWYFNTVGMYETFPNRTHDALFKAYYLLQASYWAQQAIVLCLRLEKPRRDFKELVGHHVVTLALIGLSYRFHFTYMGLAVYITHDISDFFLATSKTFSYLDLKIVPPYFGFFIAVWIYLRHYINISILHSIATTFTTIGPYELNWDTQQYKCWISQYITFGLLASLQAINIFWLYFIAKVAVKVYKHGDKKDERSDEEEEEEEKGEEEKRRERERGEMERSKGKEVELNGKVVGNGSLKENQAPVGVGAEAGDVRKRK